MAEVDKNQEKQRGWAALTWHDGFRTSVLASFTALLLAIGKITDDHLLSDATNTSEWLGILALVAGSYFGICWSRGGYLHRKFEETYRNREIRRLNGNPFSELFLYLLISLFLLSAYGFIQQAPPWWWPWQDSLSSGWHIALFILLLLSAFLPLYIAFHKNMRSPHNGLLRRHEISPLSLWLGLALVAGVAALAWAAGSNRIPTDRAFGAFIILIVLIFFLFFIAVPYVHSFALGRTKRSGLGDELFKPVAAGFTITNPSNFASNLDAALVRFVAPLTGATQPERFTIQPHLLLVSIFTPLTMMGFVLPAPWGLFPIGLAFLLAFALGRRWAWVEKDRETAMRIRSSTENQILVGFRNDLRDEALLGYAFLFILVPLALRQLQLWIAPFAIPEGGGTIEDWAQFFGVELAKAVPIVDWADIYGIQPDVAIKADTPLSRHFVFIARLMVDLVIIAALLQAWSIMQRNASQMQLFRDGQLHLLDPFAEETHFDRGVNKNSLGGYRFSQPLLDMFSDHARNSGTGIPYDRSRLGAMLADGSKPGWQALANWLVREYDLLVGPITRQISGLKLRWNSISESDWSSDRVFRTQRFVFEQLIADALDQNIILYEKDSYDLNSMRIRIVGAPEFYNAKKDLFDLFGRQNSFHATKALTMAVFGSDGSHSFRNLPEVSAYFPRDQEWGFSREPHDETRALVMTALGNIRKSNLNKGITGSAYSLSDAVLIWASKNASSKTQQAAIIALRGHP